MTSMSTAFPQEWVENPTPENARHLIRFYSESEWRDHRLDVIRALGYYSDSRSLNFLIRLVIRNQSVISIETTIDLGEQQAAILAISQRRQPESLKFLRSFYPVCPESLRPQMAYALGMVLDTGSVIQLRADLAQAEAKQDRFWLRNIILALGELKDYASLPLLRRYFEESNLESKDFLIAVMLSLGRMDRDARWLQKFENRFLSDSILNQVFQSMRAQILVRQQFKLEDYLLKILQQSQPHPALPLELRAFDSEEVEMGLALFDVKSQWNRLLVALLGVQVERRLPYLKTIHHHLLNLQQNETTDADWIQFFKGIQLLRNVSSVESAQREYLEWLFSIRPLSIPLRIKWLEVMMDSESNSLAQSIKWIAEGNEILTGSDRNAIDFLNLWSQPQFHHRKGSSVNTSSESSQLLDPDIDIDAWWKLPLSNDVLGRLIRAGAERELNPDAMKKFHQQVMKQWKTRTLNKPTSADIGFFSSAFVWFERSAAGQSDLISVTEVQSILKSVQNFSAELKKSLFIRALSFLDSWAQNQKLSVHSDVFHEWILTALTATEVEQQVLGLRLVRLFPRLEYESAVLDLLQSAQSTLELNAVIALKFYPTSKVATEALVAKIERTKSVPLLGRLLDSLCAHTTLIAKKAVLVFLEKNLDDSQVIDKVFRSFDPERKGGPEYFSTLERILQAHPEHEAWEKLVHLRDRLRTSSVPTLTTASEKLSQPEGLREVDARLLSLIPQFARLDLITQSALRAAELPMLESDENQALPIDKAPTVLEYCKSIDLLLDQVLGKRHLFPKLDTHLHEFQTLWHRLGFMEDYPAADRVMTTLGLKGKMTIEHFPLHKAKLMSSTFFNGKILQDRFKVFDGLRAWAVIFLVFARKIPFTTGPLPAMLKLPTFSDEQCISIAKRLMVLQDLRNPAAHRQTYTDPTTVKTVRTEAIEVINLLLKL
jgi:hypothetical protein